MSARKNNNGYTVHNKVELIEGGACYFNLLKVLIQKAKRSIYIRVYIWNDDQTGTAIANQLIDAAKRGSKYLK